VRVVGLTGGIGSGKSSVAALLAQRGVPIIDADAVARACVDPGSPALEAIVQRFGRDVLLPSGSLDRAALAAIVFHDAGARRDLEAITHPCIHAGIEAQLASLREAPQPPSFAVVEHPLLVETGTDARVDLVVVVEAPIETRIARVVSSRGMTREETLARIASQADDEDRRVVADRILDNSRDAAALEREVELLVAWLEGTSS
jgi:dephospho-CoA kinase